MNAIDRRAPLAPTDAATSARITAVALDQEAAACVGEYAATLRRAAAAKRDQADQITRTGERA